MHITAFPVSASRLNAPGVCKMWPHQRPAIGDIGVPPRSAHVGPDLPVFWRSHGQWRSIGRHRGALGIAERPEIACGLRHGHVTRSADNKTSRSP
jgi:hypothetical protein